MLHLCSSTTPMALPQADLPELKRFSFFISRRFEEGRERFRLHMGHFATLAEAEEWLSVVREIYPGAWAGEAPGRKLRERAAAAAAEQARHAAGPQPRAAAAPSASAKPAASPQPAASAKPSPFPPPVPAARIPVVQPAAARVPFAPAAARAKVVPAARIPVVQPAAARVPFAPAAAHAKVVPAVPVAPPAAAQTPPPARRAAPVTAPVVSRPPAARYEAQAPRPAAKPAFEDSNVREVLQALGDASATGETRQMHAPPPPRADATVEQSQMSDTQVLKLLETRRDASAEAAPVAAPAAGANGESNIPLLKPDDTQTRRALKEAVASNAPVAFAVQLHWSVQPVELDKVPPLAIFSAYTLYTVEGSRDGRKWYGLRLGFFTDAISARQVAFYVRSEFASVAVVPVSPQEKSRASAEEGAAARAAPPPVRPDPMDEFRLIDDNAAGTATSPALPAAPSPPRPAARPPARTVRAAPRSAAAPKQAVAAPAAATAAAPARAAPKARARGRVGGRERSRAQTLEETLEILGASQLSIDDGTREILNDTGVRHLRVEAQKNSPLSRLFERLSDRLKKP